MLRNSRRVTSRADCEVPCFLFACLRTAGKSTLFWYSMSKWYDPGATNVVRLKMEAFKVHAAWLFIDDKNIRIEKWDPPFQYLKTLKQTSLYAWRRKATRACCQVKDFSQEELLSSSALSHFRWNDGFCLEIALNSARTTKRLFVGGFWLHKSNQKKQPFGSAGVWRMWINTKKW